MMGFMLVSKRLGAIRGCSLVALIFFQMLFVHTDCANLLCSQKNDDGNTCKDFISGRSNNDNNETMGDVINKGDEEIPPRIKRNYVSKFTIDELLKLTVKKTISNDLDMDPEKSGWFFIVTYKYIGLLTNLPNIGIWG